jgi:hypothetical protein
MSLRHLAWFRIDDGQWLGEWRGDLAPPPVHLLMQGGDARRIGMNAWLHEIQRLITPLGSPYACVEQVWDLVAWDECPEGGAVCVDVSGYKWPVGDHRHHRWDAVEAGLDYPQMRLFIQVDRESHRIDANQCSSRPVRPSDTKAMLDVTGTALAPFHGSVTGHLSRAHGRWALTGAPVHIADGIQHALDVGEADIDGALAPPPQKVLAP